MPNRPSILAAAMLLAAGAAPAATLSLAKVIVIRADDENASKAMVMGMNPVSHELNMQFPTGGLALKRTRTAEPEGVTDWIALFKALLAREDSLNFDRAEISYAEGPAKPIKVILTLDDK